MYRLIFLDIDGVLNGHERHANGYCGTRPNCVAAFNRILAAVPDARIVVTSAWRYIAGFADNTATVLENVLLTHGVGCRGRVIGHTRRDISEERTDRGPQITEWLRAQLFTDRTFNMPAYVVLDDKDLEIREQWHPFVQTGESGLTEAAADRAIAILNGPDPAPAADVAAIDAEVS